MVVQPRNIGTLAFRLLAVVLLLGCPRTTSAAGAWSVISLPQQPGEVISPTALAVDAAGDLYVADGVDSSTRLEKRDTQGNWSILATAGDAPGQINSPTALAVDAAGNLYIAELTYDGYDRVQKRDAQGNWSVIASNGSALGQVLYPSGLAIDSAGNLYVAESTDCFGYGGNRIQKRDAQGGWSVIATSGSGPGQVDGPGGLAVDTAGNLYVTDQPANNDRIQKRDAQGNCYENRIPGPVQARGTPTAPRLAAATGR